MLKHYLLPQKPKSSSKTLAKWSYNWIKKNQIIFFLLACIQTLNSFHIRNPQSLKDTLGMASRVLFSIRKTNMFNTPLEEL